MSRRTVGSAGEESTTSEPHWSSQPSYRGPSLSSPPRRYFPPTITAVESQQQSSEQLQSSSASSVNSFDGNNPFELSPPSKPLDLLDELEEHETDDSIFVSEENIELLDQSPRQRPSAPNRQHSNASSVGSFVSNTSSAILQHQGLRNTSSRSIESQETIPTGTRSGSRVREQVLNVLGSYKRQRQIVVAQAAQESSTNTESKAEKRARHKRQLERYRQQRRLAQCGVDNEEKEDAEDDSQNVLLWNSSTTDRYLQQGLRQRDLRSLREEDLAPGATLEQAVSHILDTFFYRRESDSESDVMDGDHERESGEPCQKEHLDSRTFQDPSEEEIQRWTEQQERKGQRARKCLTFGLFAASAISIMFAAMLFLFFTNRGTSKTIVDPLAKATLVPTPVSQPHLRPTKAPHVSSVKVSKSSTPTNKHTIPPTWTAPTGAPTSTYPTLVPFASTPPMCFISLDDLTVAVDEYMESRAKYLLLKANGTATKVDPTTRTKAARVYGFPMGSWCLTSAASGSVIDDFNSLFSASRNPLFASFDEDLSGWDTSAVTDMSSAFEGCQSFRGTGLEHWNVSSTTDMSDIFRGNSRFNGNLSSWDVSSVTTMNYMFRGARRFASDLNEWNVSRVESMSGMFWFATSFNSPLDKWDVGSVVKADRMFRTARSFNQALGSWEWKSVKSLTQIFHSALEFSQDVCAWKKDVVDVSRTVSRQAMFIKTNCPIDDNAEDESSFCFSCEENSKI